MKICRMTFDIAVNDKCPDVYNIKSAVITAMTACPVVLGVEAREDFCNRFNMTNASKILDVQIKERKVLDEEMRMP